MENRELMWLEMMKYYGLSEIPGEVSNPITGTSPTAMVYLLGIRIWYWAVPFIYWD